MEVNFENPLHKPFTFNPMGFINRLQCTNTASNPFNVDLTASNVIHRHLNPFP